MPYVLNSSSATLSDVNPQSAFYKLDTPSSESGTGAGIFDFLIGVDRELGRFAQLTWAGNPKPFLTGVGLKAGGGGAAGQDKKVKKDKKGSKGNGSAADGLFAMYWGASDLKLFNDSSRYDALRIYQDGIVHKKSSNHFFEISHVTVEGEPGRRTVGVPDSGSAFALLGVGLAILFVLRRSMKEAP